MPYVPIKNRKRVLIMLMVCMGLSLAVIIKLLVVQVIRSDHYKQKAYEQQTREREVTAKRGTIYDATGTKILAQSISKSKITIYPTVIANKEEVGKKLAEILEIDLDTVMIKLNKKSAQETIYTNLDEKKEKEILNYILTNNIEGINVDEDSVRVYPYKNLLSHTLGFVGTDNQGLEGIEAMYDNSLKGVNGKIVGSTDLNGKETPFTNEQYVEPQDGKELILTIDATIQGITEKYLNRALEENQGAYATAIVMRPKTGEVLAIATAPNFDLNDAFSPNTQALKDTWDALNSKEKSDALHQMWRNRVISDTAEPGSSFKIVTAAAALEEGVTELDTPNQFVCNGYVQVGTWKIKCWRYPRTHGSESLRDGIMNSCNPVFMQASAKMGAETYNKYLSAFNLSGKTGIDLPGEASGIMHNPKTMTNVDLATTSFGQTIQISTLQTAVNYCAIANGGYLVKPYVVKEIRDTDGNFTQKITSQVVKQIVSKKTAEDVLSALETTVSIGTGKAAQVNGYRVAGKTATAEIGRGANLKYMAGFAGVAPVNNPELVVVLNIMDPRGPLGHQGSTVCAPVVANIIDESLRYLDVKPEFNIENNNIPEKIIPNLVGKTVEEATKLLTESGFKIASDSTLKNTDIIKEQIPKAGASLMDKSTVRVSINQDPKQTVTVPDLRNKTASYATKTLNNLGLNVRIIGSGYVLMQEPFKDATLEKGSIVTIKCVESLDLP